MSTRSKKDSTEIKKRTRKQKDLEVDLFVDSGDEVITNEPLKKIETENQVNTNEDSLSLSFSVSKPVYLQIHRRNIFQYFITGLISPTRYENNRPQLDIQSTFKNCLQLSNGLLDELKEDDILIDLSITEAESKHLKIYSAIALLSKPIPISRVNKIYVTSDLVKTDILATAKSTDAGIIPEYLIATKVPEDVEMIIQNEQYKYGEETYDFIEEINEFDRILGAYAFVKNTQLLLTDKTKIYSNYSEQFLGFVKLLFQEPAIIFDLQSKQLNFYKQLLELKNQDDSPVLKWLFQRAKTGVNFTSSDISEFGSILLRNHNDTEFREKGKTALGILNDGIRRRTAPDFILTNIEHRDKIYLYLFSFLYIYGNRTAEDRTNSRIGVAKDSSVSYSEFIYTLLGYFYGYSLLRNFDEKQVYLDDVINKYAKTLERPVLKFEMTTLFDYYLIESIYQYVFNGLVSTQKFEYIRVRNLSIKKTVAPNNLPPEYNFEIFEILGKQFFRLTKRTIKDELIKMLTPLPDDLSVFSDIGLYSVRNGIKFKWNLNSILSAFSDLKKLRNIAVVNKSDVLEHIQTDKCNSQELSQRISNSIKHKELE